MSRPRPMAWVPAGVAALLAGGATPARADNCSGLSDCFYGNLLPALLLLLGLILLVAAAWYLGPLLARFAMSAALRAMFSTAGRSRIAAGVARFLSRFASRAMNFSTGSLQHAFRHAKDFGVTGNWSKAAGQAFQQAIQNHIRNPGTLVVRGTYRGNPVTHFFNPNTGLNVIRDAQGGFLSGWRLSAKQIEYLLRTGALGGG
ncbi:MAG TPA: colicin D domain-containing protein [Longimicrobiaceae bacterium]|nr:colicin D domain-containing protein [Longimicrobiaceae bacterium]